jgi:hypothetical protein
MLVATIKVQHRESRFHNNEFVPRLKLGTSALCVNSGDIHYGLFIGA